jgi:hypothetical protein
LKQITKIVLSSLLIAGCAKVSLTVDTEISARAGQPVRFDAFTKDAPKSTYSWDFGDGNKGEGATLKHTYAKPGEYNAKIKVKGDRKRGNANIKVKVGPPSSLSVIPKEAGFVAVMDDLSEAKAAWDLLYKMPFIQSGLRDIEEESIANLGFFFLNESELASRGFDASLGGSFGIMSVEDQYVPLLVGGIKSDGKASAWIKERIEKEGLTTKEEKIDGVTITHTYYKNREIGAMTFTPSFVVYSPSVKTSTDYHVKALKAAALTAKNGSITENDWLSHAGLSGGISMYIQGGDFLTELSREIDGDPDLRTISSSLRSFAKSYQSLAITLRTKGVNFEADMAFWMTEEGANNYRALAPQVPLLSVSPSLVSDSFLYVSGRLDPVETAKQALAGLPPSERNEITQLAGELKGYIGVDLAEDLGKPMGAAYTMLLSLDGDGLADILSGGMTLPGEFIFAYELEDTERFQSTMTNLLQQAGMLLAFGGYSLNNKKIGDADVNSVNFGFGELAIAIKPGVAMLTVGPGPATIEKSLELITVGGNKEKSQLGEQTLVLQFGQLSRELSDTQKEMSKGGQNTDDMESLLEGLKSFQRLVSDMYLAGDVLRVRTVIELAK